MSPNTVKKQASSPSTLRAMPRATVSAADPRPAGPLVALRGLIRGLGAHGAARNAAQALDERHRRLTDLERRLAGVSGRRAASDAA